MDPNVMDLVLEMYNDGRYLSNDAQTLRQESFYRKHSVSTLR